MAETYKVLKTAEDNSVIAVETKEVWELPVKSTEVIPKGCPIYAQAFVVDKMDTVICAGDDNWYRLGPSGVVSATAGQTWAALFG